MSEASNQAKQRWNASHYSQLKVSLRPELLAAFKAKCAADGVSMAAQISGFLSQYASANSPAKPPPDPFATRPLRRKALSSLVSQLNSILDAERRYLDNIPDNLQNSRFYDAATATCSSLEEALSSLDEAY